jgi:5-methylcytosine-specific restriction protein A
MEELVENWEQAKANILTLAKYQHGTEKERWFHNRTIKNGKLFVTLSTESEYLFAPSKFAGYKSNTLAHADNLVNRDGRITNKVLDKMLGGHLSEGYLYDEIDRTFLAYCHKCSITPSQHHKKRRYWLITDELENTTQTTQQYYDVLQKEVEESLNTPS